MNRVVEPLTAPETTGLVRLEGSPTSGNTVVLCDHASNRVPPGFGTLGLTAADMRRHIAWDPGALPVARRLAASLGGPLFYPAATRLLIDCNRSPEAADSIALVSEDTEIPGNRQLAPPIRKRRIHEIYDAYHGAIADVLAQRAAAGLATALVAVHSFTPVYRGRRRPWQVGILFDRDRRLADALIARLRTDPALDVGENEPYGPKDGVYHTLHRHGEARGLPCVMVEIRNDLIAEEVGQQAWGTRLSEALATILATAR